MSRHEKIGDGYRLSGASDTPLIPPSREQILAAAGTILEHTDGDAEARELIRMLVRRDWWVEDAEPEEPVRPTEHEMLSAGDCGSVGCEFCP